MAQETPEDQPDWKLLSESVRAWLHSSPEARTAALRLVGWLVNVINEAQVAAAERQPVEAPGMPQDAPAAPDVQQPVLPFTVNGEPISSEPVSAPATEPAPVIDRAIDPALAVQLINQKRRALAMNGEPAKAPPAPATIDLQLVAKRTALKAQACRLAAERASLGDIPPGHDWDLRKRQLIAEARSVPDCYLWMLEWSARLRSDGALRLLAESFDNLSAAASLAHDLSGMDAGREDQHTVLVVLAECQSAVRLLVLEQSEVHEDTDQMQTFGWMRQRTEEAGFYIERHMRLNDPADPTQWAERSQRLQQLRDALVRHREGARLLKNAWSRLAWHTKQIDKLGAEHARDEWTRVLETVDLLVERGVHPSAAELRGLLLPVLESRPLDVATSINWSRVQQAIDEYLASQEDLSPRAPPEKELPQHVRRAASLLRGARVVLVGGSIRPKSYEALKRDLELGDLEWISSREHSSLDNFAPAIQRADTVLVLLLIRWSSHSYEGLSDICAQHDKVFVRIPTGYNPASIAHHVLEQASDRLKVARPGF